MAKTEMLYAPATWGELNALKALANKVGLDRVQSFERQGARFAAVVLAEEDEDKDKGSSDDNGDGDKPAFLKSDEEKDNGESNDNGNSDDGEGESGSDDREEPPFEKSDEGEGEEPSISEVFDLVKQIAEAVGVPVGGEDELGLEGLETLPTDDLGAGDLAAGPELPDVGAPPAGGPALPPPVPPPAGGMGGPKPKPGAMPSFAKVAGYEEAKAQKRVFDAVLEEGGSVSNKQIISEAAIFFPEHRVAKIDRRKMGEEDKVIVTLTAVQKLATRSEKGETKS